MEKEEEEGDKKNKKWESGQEEVGGVETEEKNGEKRSEEEEEVGNKKNKKWRSGQEEVGGVVAEEMSGEK